MFDSGGYRSNHGSQLVLHMFYCCHSLLRNRLVADLLDNLPSGAVHASQGLHHSRFAMLVRRPLSRCKVIHWQPSRGSSILPVSHTHPTKRIWYLVYCPSSLMRYPRRSMHLVLCFLFLPRGLPTLVDAPPLQVCIC